MAFNLRNRNFLKLLDFTPTEIKYLLDLAADLKKAMELRWRRHISMHRRIQVNVQNKK